MAVTSHAFPQAVQKLATKSLNLSSDSLKAMLLASYTAASSHATMADVLGAGTEATGTGYTSGGQALASVSLSTTGSVTTLTCSNPTWTSSTITAAYAVFYDAAGGTNSTNIPLVYWDLGGSQASAAGTFTLGISATGLLTWTSTF